MAAIESGGSRGPGVKNSVGNTASSTTNDPYAVPRPPERTAPTLPEMQGVSGPGLQQLYDFLTERMGLDAESAATMLRRYAARGSQNDALRAEMIARKQARLRTGSIDPNDPTSYGGYALEGRVIARQKEAARRRIMETMPPGPQQDQALAALEAQFGGQLADTAAASARQDEADLTGMSNEELQAMPDSGSAATMGNLRQGIYGIDTNAALQRYGIDSNFGLGVYNTQMGADTSRYGTDVGASTSRYSTDRNYNLGMEQIKAENERQRRQSKSGLLGGLLTTLGGIVAGPVGGWLGRKLGNKVSDSTTNSPSGVKA